MHIEGSHFSRVETIYSVNASEYGGFCKLTGGGGYSLKNTRLLISVLAFFVACVAPLQSAAQKFDVSPSVGFTDGIDRTAPNFVKASLLIMSPGDELYSCAGHTCIRLECPKFNLDYCFSYESESVKDKVFTFFMGKLKMGMFAIPTAEWLKMYKNIGRSIVQYQLNLPPDAKQRLWKLLDQKVAEGAYLPYDYLARGCAQADLTVLRTAIASPGSSGLVVPANWAPVRDGQALSQPYTRRECVDTFTSKSHPWNCFFLHAICGAELDREVSVFRSIVVPSDLLGLLRASKIDGKPVIDGDGEVLLEVGGGHGATALPVGEASPAAQGNGHAGRVPLPFLTPMTVSWFAVALAVVNWFVKANWLDWLFLAFQSLAGAFFTYLVAFSNLPATSWNWLIVPFNLLPLVLWKWRKKWALCFAGVLVLWEIGMIAYPHRLTDPAYLVLVVAYIIMYTRIGWQGRVRRPATIAKPVSRSCADIFEDLRRRNMERGRV